MGRALADQAFLAPLLLDGYCETPTAGRRAWLRKPPGGCAALDGAAAPERRPLRLYLGPRATAAPRDIEARARHADSETLSTPEEIERALAAGYEPRPLAGWDFPGAVLAAEAAGTVPLTLYYNRRTGDHFTGASPEAKFEAENTGYEVVGVEGYVFPDERPDTLALKLFYNAASRDHLTTASAGEEGFARANGYYLVRIEGYVPRV